MKHCQRNCSNVSYHAACNIHNMQCHVHVNPGKGKQLPSILHNLNITVSTDVCSQVLFSWFIIINFESPFSESPYISTSWRLTHNNKSHASKNQLKWTLENMLNTAKYKLPDSIQYNKISFSFETACFNTTMENYWYWNLYFRSWYSHSSVANDTPKSPEILRLVSE
jgi:hypothetical protein